jgi:hypothetical protein
MIELVNKAQEHKPIHSYKPIVFFSMRSSGPYELVKKKRESGIRWTNSSKDLFDQ